MKSIHLGDFRIGKWMLVAILCLTALPGNVYAAKNYDKYINLSEYPAKITAYVGQRTEEAIGLMASWSSENDEQCHKQYEKMLKNLTWTISDPSVAQFVTESTINEYGERVYEWGETYHDIYPHLIGLKEGKATVTGTFKNSSLTVKCKITVKYAELTCEDEVYYTGNTYDFMMKGNAMAVSFSSSDKKIATIDEETGVVKAKKAGKVTLTCLADDGKEYTRKITIKKAGLNYKNITSYYFTGFKEGIYSEFPIVAEGIDVKSWKSSNEKVVKVKKIQNIGQLEIHGTGKCTVTCTAKNGKTYKCEVTIVGGKPWSGLYGGYLPDISVVKNHGYYDDINKIQDYGKVVYFVVDYNKEIDYKNGSKKMGLQEAENEAQNILRTRYPNKIVECVGGGDLLIFRSGSKHSRLWWSCYYVE